MKRFLTLWLLTVTMICCISCDRSGSEKLIPFGQDHRSSLVVFFKIGTTHEQIEAFNNDVVNVETYALALRYRLSNGKFVGVAVDFSTKTSTEQREELKKKVQESPIVHKIYENVIPKEINDL